MRKVLINTSVSWTLLVSTPALVFCPKDKLSPSLPSFIAVCTYDVLRLHLNHQQKAAAATPCSQKANVSQPPSETLSFEVNVLSRIPPKRNRAKKLPGPYYAGYLMLSFCAWVRVNLALSSEYPTPHFYHAGLEGSGPAEYWVMPRHTVSAFQRLWNQTVSYNP